LAESPLEDAMAVRKYAAAINQRLPQPDALLADYLVHNYGRQADEILPAPGTADFEAQLLERELHFAMHREMAVLPLDFLVRRSGLLFFDIERMKRAVETTVTTFARAHGWREDQIEEERKKIQHTLESTLKFREER
jgi:glycerol-3-phosphate dehydrogenase